MQRRPIPPAIAFGLLFFVSLFGLPATLVGTHAAPRRAEAPGSRQIESAVASVSLGFEPNVGQADSAVRYLTRAQDYAVFLTDAEAVLALRRQDRTANATLRISLTGATRPVATAAEIPLPGRINYIQGSDPLAWKTNVPTYARVRYRNVYAGVDLVYHSSRGRLEYDFVLAPGANPEVIRVRFGGASGLELDANGDLLVRVGEIRLRQMRPVAYQDISGVRREVTSHYVLARDNQIRLAVGTYDRTRPLVIDPVLAYSTFLGGRSDDFPAAIAVDDAGNAYVTGTTASTNFPVSPDAPVPTGGDDSSPFAVDGFVSKFNASGSTLIYSTYLGHFVLPTDVAIDATGAIYVAGYTIQRDFTTTPGAFDRSCTPNSPTTCDAKGFVAKLAPSGAALVYSTFIGAPAGLADTAYAEVSALAVDPSGNAYLLGYTGPNFPVTPAAFQPTYGGGETDLYVAKLNAAGTSLLYGSYLGGSMFDSPGRLAIDPAGLVYLTGHTFSSDFPTTPGAYQPECPLTTTDVCSIAFVSKTDTSTGALVYSTYLGPAAPGANGGSYGSDIAADPDGNAYVTGFAETPDFPTTPGAFQRDAGQHYMNAFVTKLNPTGSALVYSTLLGGGIGSDNGSAIAVDRSRNVFVTGSTNSPDFPLSAPIQTTAYDYDAFVAKLNPSGSALIYSTLLGGGACCQGGVDQAVGIALDRHADAYIAGLTGSFDFPTTPGAFQPAHGGPYIHPSQYPQDGFVAKIAEPCGNDLSASLDVYTSPLDGIPASGYLFQLQLVAIRNRTANPIAAPLAFVLSDLRNGFPVNAAGWTTCIAGDKADPFVVLRAEDDELSPGEVAWALVLFVQTQPSAITYTPRVLSRVPAF